MGDLYVRVMDLDGGLWTVAPGSALSRHLSLDVEAGHTGHTLPQDLIRGFGGFEAYDISADIVRELRELPRASPLDQPRRAHRLWRMRNWQRCYERMSDRKEQEEAAHANPQAGRPVAAS